MKLVLIIALLILSVSAHADPIPIELFSKQESFKSVQLSPNGKYYAATVPSGETTKLVIVLRERMKLISTYVAPKNEHVRQFFWANNKRIVYTTARKDHSQERLFRNGKIYAGNIDGTKRMQIFGPGTSNSRLRRKLLLNNSGKILNRLPNDPEHILVKSDGTNSKLDSQDTLYKLNINTTNLVKIVESPFGRARVLLDQNAKPFMSYGKDKEDKFKTLMYENNAWVELENNSPIKGLTPLALNHDNSKLFLTNSKDPKREGTISLFEYDLTNRNVTKLFNHSTVDIDDYVKEPGSGNIVAVSTSLKNTEYFYFSNSKFSQLHQQLTASFPRQLVRVLANSVDENEMLVFVMSDVNPGEYYLFNQERLEIKPFLSRRKWLDSKEMRPRKAISFLSRDKQTIHGYLTLPKNSKNKHPLVVDVHGGPYGLKDKWLYDNTAQMYANNGFAVLQVNFRGSGGYGKHYEESAYLKRSTMIQYDIIDGTKWALSLDEIDDEKVCIVGGSFGGYSSLMAPLIEPDLYKCAIPMYGPYDLSYQEKHADYMKSKSSVTIGARKKYGATKGDWLKESPMEYIDNLKTPLMIVTGGKDRRVPPGSAIILKKALDKRRIKYEWLFKEKEGHGFVKPENRLELHKKSIAFLRKYLH